MMEIPLDELRYGHEAGINARRMDRTADLEPLAASLAAHGLIQALTVRTVGGVPYVADGNRRLAALRLRADRGEIPQTWPVRCDEAAADANAEEISLAANILRIPLHEADRYEAFRDLADFGLSEDDIAARFSIDSRQVRRILALGRLSPVILEAWRSNELGHRPAEVVRAFTLAKSPREQEKVFAKLKKDGQLWPATIRRALGADNHQAAKWLRLVGKDAYIAAGGKLIEDLFDGVHVVLDAQLAERLATEKLGAEVEALKGEGWSWAATGSELPQGWEHQWSTLSPDEVKPTPAERKEKKRLEEIVAAADKADRSDAEEEAAQAAEEAIEQLEAAIRHRGWTDALKARGGAVVYLDHRGQVAVRRGVLTPVTAKGEKAKARKAAAAASAGEAAPEPEDKKISNAMMQRLSVQATLGTRAALKEEPRLGLVALLAGFLAGSYHGVPVRVQHRGFGEVPREIEPFASATARLADMDDEALFRLAASIAGEALDLRRFDSAHRAFDESALAMVDRLDAGRLDAALREAFDAAYYFAGVPKPFVIAAIAEAVNDDEARKAGRLKKAELVEFAVKNVVPTGWLPPELRAATYAGPGAKPALAEAAE
jgi:ParB family chromosome partitioning protein